MHVEIQLLFRDFRLDVIEQYDSLDEAQFVWAEGRMACDCCRSDYLTDVGVLDHALPCNATGAHQIQLLALKPFVVH